MSLTLQQQFENATNFIAKYDGPDRIKPSNEQKLNYYALFKQATEGPCTRSQPGFFDAVGRAKWSAWRALQDMPKEQAMRHYVEQLTESYPQWQQWDGHIHRPAGPAGDAQGPGNARSPGTAAPGATRAATAPAEEPAAPATPHRVREDSEASAVEATGAAGAASAPAALGEAMPHANGHVDGTPAASAAAAAAAASAATSAQPTTEGDARLVAALRDRVGRVQDLIEQDSSRLDALEGRLLQLVDAVLHRQGIAPTDASAAAAAGAAATSDASAAFTAEGEPSDSAAAAIVTDGLQTSPARLYQLQCDLHARLTMLGRSVKAQQAELAQQGESLNRSLEELRRRQAALERSTLLLPPSWALFVNRLLQRVPEVLRWQRVAAVLALALVVLLIRRRR